MEPVTDVRAFRSALGCFPTGVTVITAPDPGGGLVGVTANSFNSVSLDPPLVLWSLARSAKSFEAFIEAGSFAVNVLGADQHELSAHFALRQADKFATVEIELAEDGSALLDGCVARFRCRTERVVDGGDHVVIIGEVLDFDYAPDRPALAFYQGQYSRIESHPAFSEDRSA